MLGALLLTIEALTSNTLPFLKASHHEEAVSDTVAILTIITYALLTVLLLFPKNRFFTIERPVSASVCACLVYIIRHFSDDRALDVTEAIDFGLLLTLAGMMIFSFFLAEFNFFQDLKALLVSQLHSPRRLLWLLSATTALLSALFTNDVVCLSIAGVIYGLKDDVHNILPFLLVLSTSANIGSVVTIFGNPQNTLIYNHSRRGDAEGLLSTDFSKFLLIPATLGLVLNTAFIHYWYRNDLGPRHHLEDWTLSEANDEFVSRELILRANSELPSSSIGLEARGTGTSGSAKQPLQQPVARKDTGSASRDSDLRTALLKADHGERPLQPSKEQTGTTFDAWSMLSSQQVRNIDRHQLVALQRELKKRNRHLKRMFKIFIVAVTVTMLLVMFMLPTLSVVIIVLMADCTLIVGYIIAGCVRGKPYDTKKIFEEIDFHLLLVFIGQFVVVASTVDTNLPEKLWEKVFGEGAQTNVLETPKNMLFSMIVSLLSNLVSNVPVIEILAPNIEQYENENDAKFAWLLTSWCTTIAGNLTLIGSAANIIVAEEVEHRLEKKESSPYSAWNHFKVCFPLTLVTLVMGVLMLSAMRSSFGL